MAFTVTHAGGYTSEFGDDDSYRVNDQGLVVIDSESGIRTTLSPAAWVEIKEPRPDTQVAAGF
jgi:hypothetical protein